METAQQKKGSAEGKDTPDDDGGKPAKAFGDGSKGIGGQGASDISGSVQDS